MMYNYENTKGVTLINTSSCLKIKKWYPITSYLFLSIICYSKANKLAGSELIPDWERRLRNLVEGR